MGTTDRDSIEQFVRAVADSSVSRRELMKRAAALGLSVPAAGAVLGMQVFGVNAQAPEPSGKLDRFDVGRAGHARELEGVQHRRPSDPAQRAGSAPQPRSGHQ